MISLFFFYPFNWFSILQENIKMSIEELEEQIEVEWGKVRIYLIDRLLKGTTIKNSILRLGTNFVLFSRVLNNCMVTFINLASFFL